MMMVLKRDGFAIHLSVRVEAGMFSAGDCHCSELPAGGAEIVHMPARDLSQKRDC
jgi:acetamidase/formamidase